MKRTYSKLPALTLVALVGVDQELIIEITGDE